MRESAGDLGPCCVALRLHEIGDVVEHDEASRRRLAGQPRSAHQENPSLIGHRHLCLSLPLTVAAAAEPVSDEVGELSERRHPPPPIGKRHADLVRKRLLQDHCSARIGGAQAERVVESKHTGGEVGENAFKVGAGGLDRLPVLLLLLLRFCKLRRHGVERFGEYAELVAALHRVPAAEIPLSDGARAFGEEAQRPAELFRKQDRQSERRQQRKQQRQRERQRVKTLQRRARERNLLVVAIARLHLLQILLQLLRDRLDHLQEAQRLQWISTVDRDDDAKHPSLLGNLLDGRISLLQPRLAQRLSGWRLRRQCRPGDTGNRQHPA